MDYVIMLKLSNHISGSYVNGMSSPGPPEEIKIVGTPM